MQTKYKRTGIWKISILLLFSFIVFISKLKVQAADIASGTSGTCTWQISEDGTLSIYPTDGKSGTLAEPESGQIDTWTTGSIFPWTDYKGKITAIYINQGTVYAPKDCSHMFYRVLNATQMDISSLDTSNTTNMSNMFEDCYKLKRFALSHFDVSNVTQFQKMFSACENAEFIDIHGWDMTKNTNSTEQMTYEMFYNVGRYSETGLLDMNLNNVKFPRNCAYMLWYAAPSELHMDNVDFSEVYDFTYFLADAWYNQNLKSLSITNVGSMDHVTSTQRMFADNNGSYSQVQSITLKGFSNAKSITNCTYMFRAHKKLTTLVSDFSTGNQLTNAQYMFVGCNNLSYIDLTNLDVSNAKMNNLSIGIVSSEQSHITLNISGWDMSKWETNYAQLSNLMSKNDNAYMTIIANDIKLPHNSHYNNAVQIYAPFYGVGDNEIIAHNVDFSGIESLSNFFSSSGGYSSSNASLQPRKIDFSAVNTGDIKYLNYAFYTNKQDIYALDLTWIKDAKIESMIYTFGAPLQYVDLSTLDTTAVADNAMTGAFANCADTIQTIVLGAKTQLRSTAGLPDVRWVNQETAEALTTSELIERSQTAEGAAGTWKIAGRQSYISLTDNIYDVLAHSNYTESTDSDGNTIKIPGSIKDGEDPVSLYQDLKTGGGYWQKLSNDLWAYHFFVFDNDTVWKIWEDPVTGFESSNASDNAIEIAGSDVAMLRPTITNTKKTTVKTGSLSLKKIAVDTDGKTELTTDQTFAFAITLAGDNITGNQIFGSTAFTDGKANVSLSVGETILFTDIPVNTTYTIEEQGTAGFVGTIDNPTGTISESESAVICTNKRTEEAKKETSSFTVSKVVVSNADETSTEFQLHAVLSGLLPYETYKLSNGTSYQADKNGNADVAFKLKDKESVSFLALPIGSTYLIAEDAGSYIPSYRITDKNNVGKIVSTMESGTSTEQSLATKTETLDKGEDVTVQFTNKITRTENLTLTKVSLTDKDQIDSDDVKQYTIDVHLSGLEEKQKIFTSNGPLIADEEGVIDITMFISPSQKIIFYDLPVGTKYQFTEEENDKAASYTITNISSVVSASGANTSAQKALSTAEETVDLGENATVTFTNTSPKSAKLQVIKYDNSTDKNRLGGAEFALYKEDGTPVNFTADGTNVIRIKDNGSSDVLESSLFVAGTYYLEETKAPDGYMISESKSFTIAAADAGKTLQIEVYDDRLIVLPVTGGEGRERYISIACVLMALSASLLIYKKRQRNF